MTGLLLALLQRTTPVLLLALLTACGDAPGPVHRDERALVLVAGATGGTGQQVVRRSLAEGYRVRVLVRDAGRARALFGDGVEYAAGNVRDPGTLPAAVRGARYVVSALGSNSRREPANTPELVDYLGVKALAEASKAAGVRQFVLVSAMGVTDPDNMLNRILDNLMSRKFQGEEALRASGVPYTIVRPGGLRDGPGGVTGIRAIAGDPRDVAGQIDRADVAAVCVNALGRRDALGKTIGVIADPERRVVDWKRFFADVPPDAR